MSNFISILLAWLTVNVIFIVPIWFLLGLFLPTFNPLHWHFVFQTAIGLWAIYINYHCIKSLFHKG